MSEEIKGTRQEGILFTIDCLKNHKFNFDYCLDQLIEEATNLQTQLQQKENIIKEVREWAKKLKYETLWQSTREELLKILDKGE